MTYNTLVLLRIKYWTVWYIERYSTSTYTGISNFQNPVRFFRPPCTCTNWGENIYEDTAFTRFFGSLPAVTLICNLWSQKLITTSTNQTHLLPKLGEISLIEFWDMVFTRFSGQCLLWPWTLTFWPNHYQCVPGPGIYILVTFTQIQRYSIHRVLGRCLL